VDNEGVEATVVVKNPCNFPIEFYALDFDEQYLEKEKVRRQVHVRYHWLFHICTFLATKEQSHLAFTKSPFLGSEEMGRMVRIKGRQQADFSPWFCTAAHHKTVSFSPESTVKATGSPVSRAVLHHPGIAPSSGWHEAQQHRGLVVIIHGPPRAG
ncbi:HYDIN protein, partial [Pheucticus melanocephalus]|nr:HYDIN protein [Pheucticus melanocephalus]